MCRYSFGNGRCASMEVKVNFCVGESNCYLTDILRNRTMEDDLKGDFWYLIPSKIWKIGNQIDEDK